MPIDILHILRSIYMVAHDTLYKAALTRVCFCSHPLDGRSLLPIAERGAEGRVPHLLVLTCAEPVHRQEPVPVGDEGELEVVGLLSVFSTKNRGNGCERHTTRDTIEVASLG